MKRTDTLIRLKLFRVDEMQRRMASIDAMKREIERKLADMDHDIAREMLRAGDSDIGKLAFPSFLRSIESRCENLRTTLKEIEREYAAVRADLSNAIQDLESLEVATKEQDQRLNEKKVHRLHIRLNQILLVKRPRK